MVVAFEQLLDDLDRESATVRQAIDALRRQSEQRPARLRTLAEQRTSAFVELARHYLPELSHQRLADTWIELRKQIHDVLLRMDDDCRRLHSRLNRVQSNLRRLESEKSSIDKQHQKARRDLSSKQGNARKLLGEDPQVAACIDAIDKLDADIDRALLRLDTAESDAKTKLPDYEACHLFSYLRERNFGTPQYAATGLERRWDRWLAKFVNYDHAKASYDHLSQAPDHLRRLIDNKRQQYQDLLSLLEQAHRRADAHFSVDQQRHLTKKLAKQIQKIELCVGEAEYDANLIRGELEEVQREHYDHAIAIYQRFLCDLDPEILRVYAACTESPIDDQICARIRKIQSEITAFPARSGQHDPRIIDLQKYLSGLNELSWRLARDARETPNGIQYRDGLAFRDCLADLRQKNCTPNDAWRGIQAAIIRPHGFRRVSDSADFKSINRRRTVPDSRWTSSAPKHPLESSFMAASGQTRTRHGQRPLDPADIVLLTPEDARRMASDLLGGFVPVALCRFPSDARQLTRWLERRGIVGFMHNHEIGDSLAATQLNVMDDIVVMVRPMQFDRAHKLIARLQSDHVGPWNCQACAALVDAGYRVCWQCGGHASLAFDLSRGNRT